MGLPRYLWASAIFCTLALASIPAPVARGGSPDARALLADQLLDDARTAVRNARLPIGVANREAMVLLQEARQLAPDSPDVYRALAEAATFARQMDMEHDALKNLVRLEPDNLVAQVQFLDLLAQRRQTVEQKIAVYQSALDSTTLNPQVRSEMAVRLYRLLLLRGQSTEANAALTKALELNDVNTGAWSELCAQLAQTPGKTAQYMQALVNLLQANPYQPAALQEGADLLAAHNEHSLAADWLKTSVEQLRINGAQIPVETFQAMAYELAASNRRTELDVLLQSMLAQDKPPLPAMLLAYTVHAPQGVVPGLADDPLDAMIRKQLGANVAADPKNPQALVDALWFDLFYAPALPDDIINRLKKLEDMVTAADLRYQRLRAWDLLRTHQTKAAKELLTPIAYQDPYAVLGLIRIAQDEGDTKAVSDGLQSMYTAHPTGLLAVHIINEARKQNVTLTQTELGQQLHDIAANYPAMLLAVQRQPRDLVLIEPSLSKRRYNYCEPIVLNLKITNTSDHALAVGPNGAVKVGVAILGTLRGLGTQELGPFAIDNSPRVFRLERHDSLVQQVRVDTGLLRDVLMNNPTRLMDVDLTIINEPHGSMEHLAMGLGGQVVRGASFEREGFSDGTMDAYRKLVSDLPTLPLEQRMLDSGALAVVMAGIKDDAAPAITTDNPDGGDTGAKTSAQLKQSIVETLSDQMQTADSLVQAWLLRMTPVKDIPQNFTDDLTKAGAARDALVRILWYRRNGNIASMMPEHMDEVLALLRKAATAEKDPLAKEYASALAEDIAVPPATAPAASGPTNVPTNTPAEAADPLREPAVTDPAPPASLPATSAPALEPIKPLSSSTGESVTGDTTSKPSATEPALKQ